MFFFCASHFSTQISNLTTLSIQHSIFFLRFLPIDVVFVVAPFGVFFSHVSVVIFTHLSVMIFLKYKKEKKKKKDRAQDELTKGATVEQVIYAEAN